jgi:6-phospho-3-hexuloisomerase
MVVKFKHILNEIENCLHHSDLENVPSVIREVINARTVITYGAGRVGLVMRGFSKRLMHLGLNSYFLEDSTVPSTSEGDLLLVGSGSGNTPTTKLVAELAVKNGLKLISVTANPDSSITTISNVFICLNTPTKETNKSPVSSIQPMTTLFEQTLSIFLDALVLELMTTLNENSESMKQRHNVIE